MNYIKIRERNSAGGHELYTSGWKWRSVVGSCEPLGSTRYK